MLGEREPARGRGCLNKRVLGAICRDVISRRDGKPFALEARWDFECCVQSGKLEEAQRWVIRVGKVSESPFMKGN